MSISLAFDRIDLDRLDTYSILLKPFDRSLDLFAIALELHRDQTDFFSNRRLPDIEDHVELFAHVVNERLGRAACVEFNQYLPLK